MFEILKTYGDSFKAHWWDYIFKIVFRIFDIMKSPDSQYEVRTSCTLMLHAALGMKLKHSANRLHLSVPC